MLFDSKGESAALVADAQNLLKLDPLREERHYALIEAHGQLGFRAAAMEQYVKCRRMLLEEWAAEPVPESNVFIAAIQSRPKGRGIAVLENLVLTYPNFVVISLID